MSQNAPKPIPQTLNSFGLEFTFIGIFTDAEQIKKNIKNWKNAGHKTMVKNDNRLYVSKNRIRNY